MLRPVDEGYPITQEFGENPDWYPLTHGHNGIDYGVPMGTPVFAAADGKVQRAEMDATGYGLCVRIEHPDGKTTIYGHLSSILVKAGQDVRIGDTLGLSGSTGRSTGPHLHFEVRTGPAATSAVDPAPLLDQELTKPILQNNVLFTAKLTPEGVGLRVRMSPSTSGGILGYLSAGDVVNVRAITGDVWLLTDKGYIKYDPNWLLLNSINQ